MSKYVRMIVGTVILLIIMTELITHKGPTHAEVQEHTIWVWVFFAITSIPMLLCYALANLMRMLGENFEAMLFPRRHLSTVSLALFLLLVFGGSLALGMRTLPTFSMAEIKEDPLLVGFVVLLPMIEAGDLFLLAFSKLWGGFVASKFFRMQV